MTFARTDDGIWCPGSSAAAIITTINTINGGTDLDSAADVVMVGLAGFHAAAALGDFSVDWGNGTTWEAMTLRAEDTSGGQMSAIFSLIGPTVTYDRFRVNTTRAYSEGVSASFAALSADGTVTYIDAVADTAPTTTNATGTLTGGANGDYIYVHGSDSTFAGDAFDLSLQSQTVIETEEATACNAQHYGHAFKDWSAGATVEMSGSYPDMAAVVHNDAGGGGTILPMIMQMS